VSAPRILVIGVGGIGGPAALALAQAGDVALRVVDPDVVDVSNLPRQILFGDADVGREKARVAAERLGAMGAQVEAIVDRLDRSTAAGLFAGVAVAIDATDGAAAKDLVNATAIDAGVPLVHAAALSSEARLLDGPAGGAPCIACLFGYASESGETAGDTCARVGVWPCVPGAIGALAAHVAHERIARPSARSGGLRVLDFALPRALTLEAVPDAACPACGRGRRLPREVESTCRGGGVAPRAGAPPHVLDLRRESCPMNLLRARRAVDARAPGETLEIWLGAEGGDTVPSGLASLGHVIERVERAGDGLTLLVRRRGAAASADAGEERLLARFSRQIVLPDFGDEGQRRVLAARVVVEGGAEAGDAAAIHLQAAGVGAVERRAGPAPGAWGLRSDGVRFRRPVRACGPLARFDGAVAADRLLRAIVTGRAGAATIEADAQGRVRSAPSTTSGPA